MQSTNININTYNFESPTLSKYCGENIGTSKLTVQKVGEIKKLLYYGHNATEIAKQFSVNKSTISSIKNHRSWAYVKLYDKKNNTYFN